MSRTGTISEDSSSAHQSYICPFHERTLNLYPAQDIKPIADIYFWLQDSIEQPLQGQVLRSPRLAAKAAGDLPRLRALH